MRVEGDMGKGPRKRLRLLKRVMELSEKLETHEVLKAQAHIWNHLFRFVDSMSLKCAVQLGIPDIIHNHGHPISLSELVAVLPISPAKKAHVGRLMRMLVHSGIFAVQKVGVPQAEDAEERYVLTPSSMLLLKDTTTSLSPFLLMILDPILVSSWHWLSTWFEGNEPTAFEINNGMNLFSCAHQDTQMNNKFNQALASDCHLVMSIVVKESSAVFEGVQSLVDVGGGTGTAAKIIADAFPHMECTVFDLPHVVASVPKSKNLDVVGGDMFKSIPSADAIFLKWILHDWDDDDCVKILERCKEAIPCEEKGGKVIIVDMVLNTKQEHELTETQLFFDMVMMAMLNGKERNEREWAKLFLDAGFTRYKITPILGLRSLIELFY